VFRRSWFLSWASYIQTVTPPEVGDGVRCSWVLSLTPYASDDKHDLSHRRWRYEILFMIRKLMSKEEQNIWWHEWIIMICSIILCAHKITKPSAMVKLYACILANDVFLLLLNSLICLRQECCRSRDVLHVADWHSDKCGFDFRDWSGNRRQSSVVDWPALLSKLYNSHRLKFHKFCVETKFAHKVQLEK
jgi:hypothetical protein